MWETVGDRGVDPFDIAFDHHGVLWSGTGRGIARLDLEEQPVAIWQEFGTPRSANAVLPLGVDTLIADRSSGLRRSLDGGQTWSVRHTDGASALYEVPATPGLPADLRAGHLLAVDRDGLYRSPDRSATWQVVPGLADRPTLAALVLPACHPHAGRLIAVTLRTGVYTGEAAPDGTLRMAWTVESGPKGNRALEHLALLPSGRILATGFRNQEPHNRAFTSDDGGETWVERAALPEPAEGIPGDAFLAVLGNRSALAIGGRGVMYRTGDDGETWRVVGRTPVTESTMTSRKLLVGSEGRLYVGLILAGPTPGWVMRTVFPVPVSNAEPPAASGVGLSVSPNPASGAVRIEVSLPSPEAVEIVVVDARGREVVTVDARGPVEVSTEGWACTWCGWWSAAKG